MNKFKIVIGFLLLYGIGQEYINASKQFLTFLDPTIIILCLLMLVLCAWLIGSGFSKEKIKIKSFQFAKYYGLSFIIFLLIAFVSLMTYKFEPEIVKVNGIDVDIAEFMNGTKKIVPDENQRREYCICVVTKLTGDKDLIEKYKHEFEIGKFSKVIIDIQTGSTVNKYNLNECFGSLSSIQWTPAFEKGMRASLINQIRQLDISKTNDTTKYCDCLMDQYKKIPITELTNSDFPQSQKNATIDSICNAKSKIK